MVPPYHNPFPLELSGDHGDHHYHHNHHLFNLQVPQTSFNSSLSSPVFLTPDQVAQGRRTDHFREPQDFQFQLLEADHNIVSYGGSCQADGETLENEAQETSLLKLTISRNGNINPSGHDDDDEMNTSSVKWMSSKMRMIRKMTNPDQTAISSSSDDKPVNVPIIRVCSDCNTTKTPLWRSGPRGPKSLCNACGIRQRKARRAMAAAAAEASGATLVNGAAPSTTSATSKAQQKDNKSSPKSTLPFKKRCNKLMTPSPARGRPKKLRFEDHFTITMKNNNSPSATATGGGTLQTVFPQDEKDAAILLMALSCGLVHG